VVPARRAAGRWQARPARPRRADGESRPSTSPLRAGGRWRRVPGSAPPPVGSRAGSPAPSASRVRPPSPAPARPGPATTSRTRTDPPPTALHPRPARPETATASPAARSPGCGRRTPDAGRCRTGATPETVAGHPPNPTHRHHPAAATPRPASPGPRRCRLLRRPAGPPSAADGPPRVRPAPAAVGSPGSVRSPARRYTTPTSGRPRSAGTPPRRPSAAARAAVAPTPPPPPDRRADLDPGTPRGRLRPATGAPHRPAPRPRWSG
jgi:hypothetical protein